MPFDPQLLSRAQQDLNKTIADRGRLNANLAQRNAEIAGLDTAIDRAATRGDTAAVAALTAQRKQAEASRREELTRVQAADDQLRAAVDILATFDACDADPTLPLLLLPVRLETRYTADRTALRVRIFPDDVHIDQLDTGVDETEIDVWKDYWTSVWRGTDAQADQAWTTLVQRVGARRATWLAAGVVPTNLATRNTAQGPIFPAVAPRSRRAAVARLLPDRFVAVAFQGADRRVTTGKPVAPEVPVGILADDGSAFVDVNGVKVMAGAEWVVDYAAAEKIGMAVTVPLARPGVKVDRLVVMGVRRTLDPAASAKELDKLLLAHQCTGGLGFVAQGTLTNNTESDRAAWQSRVQPPRPPRDIAAGAAAGTNAQVLAAALGIDGRQLAALEGGTLREQPQARAANIAFWGTSWGAFLDKANMVGPNGATLSDATIEKARVLNRDAVRGRGPLPTLRVGNQPYGMLPVMTFDAPHWKATAGDTFEAQLTELVNRARVKWRHAATSMPRVIGAPRIDEALRDMLGASPVSTALRVRTVLSDEASIFGLTVSNGDANALTVEHLIEELILEDVILNASLMHRIGSLASKSRPLGLSLSHDDDVAFMDALLAGAGVPKITSVWQALLQLSWAIAEREVAETGGAGRFGDVVTGATLVAQADRDRIVTVASSADRLSSVALQKEADRVQRVLEAAGPLPTHVEYQPFAATRRGFGELALSASSDAAKAALSSYAVWAHMQALARRAELREAVTELRTTSKKERRILLAETIDCASHRLDAWCTGLVERRRQQHRAAKPAGLTVGAYGWVEDIEPTGDRQGDGGYVHAPSLSHAATAGILRSAFLTHNGPGGDGAFAIDLSSSRVRTALYLDDGIRQGQPLSALLGYRIERDIHEAGLDRLILSLRTIAPLTQGKLTDRGQNAPLSAIEALAASNVTDGVDLIEKYQGRVANWTSTRIRNSLNTKPQNNPYLEGEAWPALTDAEWTTVVRIIEDAVQACDAVSDLLMAESVHQLVLGNVSRAAAALDAAGPGEAPPPAQPAVIETPVEGIPLAHRLLVIAGTGRPWNPARPRAAAEPRLEAWAGARLGDPATIRVTDDGPRTLADTGLCALDIVYDAGNPALLEQRVRSTLALTQDIALVNEPAAGWPEGTRAFGEIVELAGAVRALLANARPAGPGDLARPGDLSTREPSVTDLNAAVERVTLAQGGLKTAADELKARIDESPVDELALWATLEAAAAYGVVAPTVSGEQLAVLATATQAEAARRVAAARTLLDEAHAAQALPDSSSSRSRVRDRVIAAGKTLFGDGFWIVPELEAPAEPDLWQLSLSNGAIARPGQIRRFLADVAAVREPIKRVSDALLLAESLGQPGTLRVAQLAPAGTTDRWIGGPLDPAQPTPQEPITSVILDAPDDYVPTGPTAALVVDQWTDVVPVRERRGPEATAPIDERATSGISFNAMAPSSRAPNAMLVAVAPGTERWTTESLLETLLDTLDLAKLRLVTLERTIGTARVLPALYQQNYSLQGEPALDFRFVSGTNYIQSAIAAYIKE